VHDAMVDMTLIKLIKRFTHTGTWNVKIYSHYSILQHPVHSVKYFWHKQIQESRAIADKPARCFHKRRAVYI